MSTALALQMSKLKAQDIQPPPRGIEYKSLAFMLVKPGTVDVVSTHRAKNRDEYLSLVRSAKNKSLCLYYADLVSRGEKSFATQPWILDTDTVPVAVGEPPAESVSDEPTESDDPLKCPYCETVCTKAFGLTLHIKSKHPDQSLPTKKQSDSSDDLSCPYCDVKPSSKSGLTLHIKSRHPEKLGHG